MTDLDPAIRAGAEALCRKRHPQRFIAISSSQCECTECYEYARIAVEAAVPLLRKEWAEGANRVLKDERDGHTLTFERLKSAERERDHLFTNVRRVDQKYGPFPEFKEWRDAAQGR